ncbi:class I SAM-dependent methyltransferase [Streptosporangium canum]|uniref:class I SAM-dependent methyltransferase n=1 Tax=Streptosporangium canum TaxID=324952 RepID=UPI00339DC2EE
MTAEPERWNHNIHYHPMILRTVPDGCGRALDVGCGEGILSRELRRTARHVSAIDLDGPSIELARRHDGASDIDYLLGDFLTHPFEPASFDAVVSVATLHHMDAAVALDRMRGLLRPGGRLVVVGLARSRLPADLPYEVAAVIGSLLYRRTRTYWEHSAPTVWPPPESYAGMRRVAEEVLPGVRYRRHLLWRYSLIWTRPAS